MRTAHVRVGALGLSHRIVVLLVLLSINLWLEKHVAGVGSLWFCLVYVHFLLVHFVDTYGVSVSSY